MGEIHSCEIKCWNSLGTVDENSSKQTLLCSTQKSNVTLGCVHKDELSPGEAVVQG